MTDEIPRINSEGHSYLVTWPEEDFVFPPGSWSVAPDDRVLSIKGAIEYAEEIVQQHITWLN